MREAPTRANHRADDDAVDFINESLQKRGDVVTPFDARRVALAAPGSPYTFDDVTAMIRAASADDERASGRAQRGVDVRRFVEELRRRRARDDGDDAARSESAAPRDPLVELARELLPEYGGRALGEAKAARAETARARRLAAADARSPRTALDERDEAIRAMTSELERVKSENATLRTSLAESREVIEVFEQRTRRGEAREATLGDELRELRNALYHEISGRETLRAALTRASEELQSCRESSERAIATEMALELRLKALRNGDLVAALRERVIECQKELAAERKASDMARRRYVKEKTKTDAFIFRLRDKARALGIRLDLLDARGDDEDEDEDDSDEDEEFHDASGASL